MKPPLIVLTGPTASGKTDLSIQLAKSIGGEIINADSISVYRYMDIGSAKITKEEMQGIPHYLVGELDPKDEFNAYIFQKKAKEYMKQIYAHKKIPIIVGGTGFYIQALLYDIHFDDQEQDHAYRKELQALSEQKGTSFLYQMLLEKDPVYAQSLHENNVKRVIRALEYIHDTGEKFSVHNEKEQQRSSPYDFCYFVINMDRSRLYERINQRVDKMMQQGLVDEVKQLLAMGYDRNLVSMQGLGYKEIVSYLNGEISLDTAVEIIKRDTRHFAKRQITWFKREKDVIWMNDEEYHTRNDMLQHMIKIIEEEFKHEE